MDERVGWVMAINLWRGNKVRVLRELMFFLGCRVSMIDGQICPRARGVGILRHSEGARKGGYY